MIRQKRGLIVEITENDILGGGGNPLAWVVKIGTKTMALNMATELFPYGVTAVAVTPGFLRSEAMLEAKGVTEANWRDAGKADRNFLESESPIYVGRAVAALAADPHMHSRTGHLWSSWELGRAYGFTDADGRRPDWGAHPIDFSNHPPALLDLFRTGFRLQHEWLAHLVERTSRMQGQLPREQAPAAGV